MRDHELTAANITDPRLVNAYRVCDARLRGQNPAAYPGARCLLPATKRPYYDAILAFCRHVDDLLDDPERSAQERAERFDRFQNRLAAVFDGETHEGNAAANEATVDHHVAEAFVHVTRIWGISRESVRFALCTLRSDLDVAEYPTFRELEKYIRAVSGEPAIWINTLLEPRTPEADRMAIALSHALCLLHLVHDIAEDLRLGRIYLPQEDLALVGLSRDTLTSATSADSMTEPLRQLVRHQADRAERLLTESEEWWRVVHPSSRLFVRRYHALGRASLRRLARRDYDVIRSGSRIQVAWQRTTTLGGTGLAFLRAATEQQWRTRSPEGSRASR